ncbi:unnamed protein product [Acanthoscelides obtectus]|uniref:Uncharacterized protein n=1 Tax=Acanthoscelides obtectus TaxID=200917 RepID=A0A9P0Q1U5_ACAOB|nr:unnamed protein product [Acanthoscelides obtectus]CAK1635433.1 hypothetical protein AOBTE_LOCUS9270 [Acanthoscelides obtectus]
MATEIPKLLDVEAISWNYFESGHGKGAVDGVGGCLKRTADRLVACQYDLQNLELMVFHLTKACPGMEIVVISSSSISEFDNKIPISGIKTFVGTMKVHQACWTTTNPDYLELRRLSCTVCPESVRCVHYSLGHYEIKQNRPKKVAYSDISTDSENEEEQMKLKTKSLKGGKKQRKEDNAKCGICLTLYSKSKNNLEWIQCLNCQKWICGMCNKGSKNAFFTCAICDDSDDDYALATLLK